MGILFLILVIAALVLAIVAIVEASGRNWAAWGVLMLAIAELLQRVGAGVG